MLWVACRLAPPGLLLFDGQRAVCANQQNVQQQKKERTKFNLHKVHLDATLQLSGWGWHRIHYQWSLFPLSSGWQRLIGAVRSDSLGLFLVYFWSQKTILFKTIFLSFSVDDVAGLKIGFQFSYIFVSMR